MSAMCLPLLDYLWQRTDSGSFPPESVFHYLRSQLDADGIGISWLEDHRMDCRYFAEDTIEPAAWPWARDPGLAERMRVTLDAHGFRDAGGDWLACYVSEPRSGDPCVAWLFRSTARGVESWDSSSQAGWPTLAQVLLRWLAQQTQPVASQARLRRDLERAAALTSRLSHDFGNYLTGILGFTELGIAQAPVGSVLHRYLQEVLQSAQQGARWLRRLHWFCRRHDQATWPSELGSVLAEIRSRQSEDIAGRWRQDIPADLPLLAIDAVSLQTVLEELCHNAVESTSGGAALRIAARVVDLSDIECRSLLGTAESGRFVEITLADDGPGFSAEARDKVFHEPFFSTKPRHRGLGLLIAYGILHRFHGAVRIGASAHPHGAVVQVLLPTIAMPGDPRPEDATPHLLLVHPDHHMAASLRRLLEWQGCKVTVVPNAQTAIGVYQARDQSFALVLAEVALPQLSGFDLARRVLDRDSKARFVFLHTSPFFHGIAEEEMVKRFALLRWPMDPAAFIQAVNTALGRATRTT